MTWAIQSAPHCESGTTRLTSNLETLLLSILSGPWHFWDAVVYTTLYTYPDSPPPRSPTFPVCACMCVRVFLRMSVCFCLHFYDFVRVMVSSCALCITVVRELCVSLLRSLSLSLSIPFSRALFFFLISLFCTWPTPSSQKFLESVLQRLFASFKVSSDFIFYTKMENNNDHVYQKTDNNMTHHDQTWCNWMLLWLRVKHTMWNSLNDELKIWNRENTSQQPKNA